MPGFPFKLPLFAILFIVVLNGPGSMAQAAHPLRLADYSTGSRVEFEAAFGRMNVPLAADYQHYLLSIDYSPYPEVHTYFALPFSGYQGIDHADNFIRGNIMTGAGYRLALTDWVSLGFSLRLFLPTYDQAEPVDYGLPQDPRRAILTHWHSAYQYALADYFPIKPALAVRFEYAHFFLQLDGGFTWAPKVEDTPGRPENLWMLEYGAGLGYDIMGYVELGASLTGLADPDKKAKNLGDVMGLSAKRPRSLHVVTVGPRAQYKWAVLRFEANFPLESRFRSMLDPYYSVAFQVQWD